MSSIAQYKEYKKRLNKENAALKLQVEKLEKEKKHLLFKVDGLLKIEKQSVHKNKPNIFSRIIKFFSFKINLIFQIISIFTIISIF